MSILCVHLQEGFDGDLVIIRMNGAEWARRPYVLTQPLLGYAEFVDLPKLTEADIRLDVSLPNRGLDQSATVSGAGDTFIAANVEDGAAAAFDPQSAIRCRVKDLVSGEVSWALWLAGPR